MTHRSRPLRSNRILGLARGALSACFISTALVPGLVPQTAEACAFHTALPEKPLSQVIADSPVLVAARPDVDDPFHFTISEVLKGQAPPDQPPFLVDATTRRRLAASPHHAVLFARGAKGGWTRLLYLDEATAPVARAMIGGAARWSAPDGAVSRRDFATKMLAQKDATLRRLVLRELDSLDYRVLRGARYPLAADDLIAAIGDMRDQPYAPIRILLLGLSGDEVARDEARRQLDWRLRMGVAKDLGAWMTAAMELRGADALADLERGLAARSRPLTPAQSEEIVRALAIQSAAGDPELRQPIREALLRLVERSPVTAPLIPRALSAASDRAQAGLVRDLVAARAFTTRTDLLAATAYLATALDDARPSRPSPAIDRFRRTAADD